MKNISPLYAGFVKTWDKFWFATSNPRIRSIARIGIGFTLLCEILLISHIFTLGNIIPHRIRFVADLDIDQLRLFRFPYPGLDWLPIPSFQLFGILEIVMLISCIAFIIGLFTRVSGIITVLIFDFIFFQSQVFFHHQLFVLMISLNIICLCKCNHRYSIDALFNKKKIDTVSALPQRLLQILVVYIHFFAGLHKIRPGWLNGNTVKVMIETGALKTDGIIKGFVPSLIQKMELYQIAGIVMVCAWLIVGISFFIPKYRKIGALAGIALQVSVEIMTGKGVFAYLMITLFLLILFDDSLKGNLLFWKNKKNTVSIRR